MTSPDTSSYVELTCKLLPSYLFPSLDIPDTLKVASIALVHSAAHHDTPQPICNCNWFSRNTFKWCMFVVGAPWSYRRSTSSSSMQAYPGASLWQDVHLVYCILFSDLLWLLMWSLPHTNSRDRVLMSWTVTITEFPTLDPPRLLYCHKQEIFVESWCI